MKTNPKKYRGHMIADCVSASTRDVERYDDTEKTISYKTFLKYVGAETMKELNERFGVPLSKDWHVSFGKGKFRNTPVVCLHHSSIHHFFAYSEI